MYCNSWFGYIKWRMEKGLAQAKAGLGLDIDDAFSALEHSVSDAGTEDAGSKSTSFPCFPV